VSATPSSLPSTPQRAWLLLALSGAAGALFFVDRHTLSVLKTTLGTERGWTDADYAWLVTMFMGCYTLCYLFTGRFIDRWGTRVMMPFFLCVMSLATIGCGLATDLRSMGLLRGLLGFGQAGIMPAILVTVFRWFPRERRGTATSIKEPIYIAGQVLAIPFAVWATSTWSWRAAFLIPGAAGLILAAVWWRVDSVAPGALGDGRGSAPPPPLARESPLRLFRNRSFVAILIARVLTDPVWFFYVNWEPSFLQDHLGLSFGSLAHLGWIPTATGAAAIFAAGAISDQYVIRRNWSPARSRRRLLQSAALLAPALAAVPFVRDPILAIVLLSLARGMMAVWLNFSNLLIADQLPLSSVGTAVSLVSAAGGAAGLAVMLVAGHGIQLYGYGPLFIAGACVHPLAALLLWSRAKKSAGPFPGPRANPSYA
jgi:ACS family hexuronate transporter-like MFS transporter